MKELNLIELMCLNLNSFLVLFLIEKENIIIKWWLKTFLWYEKYKKQSISNTIYHNEFYISCMLLH